VRVEPIRVWTWSLGPSAVQALGLLDILSDEERSRARRLVRPQDSVNFVAAHAGVRQILGEALGLSPATLQFVTSAHGKPALATHCDLHFNLSHSGDVAVLAVSRSGPVGVDVEIMRALSPGLAGEILVRGEADRLQAVPDSLRAQSLLAYWVAKEAVMKLHGDSQSLRPQDVEVAFDGAGGYRVLAPMLPSACHLQSIEVRDDCIAMVASYRAEAFEGLSISSWALQPK
jgi:4'-phosphopantetheinyl transferase